MRLNWASFVSLVLTFKISSGATFRVSISLTKLLLIYKFFFFYILSIYLIILHTHKTHRLTQEDNDLLKISMYSQKTRKDSHILLFA